MLAGTGREAAMAGAEMQRSAFQAEINNRAEAEEEAAEELKS
jgi:hypothetical protein